MSQDYSCVVKANVSAEDAFGKLSRISDWWNQKATGSAQKAGDKFRVDFGETWVDFEVVEAVSSRRISWRIHSGAAHAGVVVPSEQ
jgi:hypothetical protein